MAFLDMWKMAKGGCASSYSWILVFTVIYEDLQDNFFKRVWEGERVSPDALLSLLILQLISWHEHSPRHKRSSVAITIREILQLSGKDSLSLVKHWWGSQRSEHLFVSLVLLSYFLHLHEALVLCVGAYPRSADFCFSVCIANGGFYHQACT